MMRLWRWRRDPHPWPHMLNEAGGCACLCSRCVRMAGGQQKCHCPRCNQECSAIGRLGSPDAVAKEQQAGYPLDRRPGSRWFRR